MRGAERYGPTSPQQQRRWGDCICLQLGHLLDVPSRLGCSFSMIPPLSRMRHAWMNSRVLNSDSL
jgi:hypothetical protein